MKKNVKRQKYFQFDSSVIISSAVTFVVCLLFFVLFYEFYLGKQVVEKTIKDITITDTGIADAVEKVYDSVVVVENYVKDTLYSTGTGFVFKKDDKYGYIITNNHVVDGAQEIKVIFTNNESIVAKVVGTDSYSDIAVLAVDKKNVILVAQTGSSDDMRVGDTTFAVGAPIDSSVYSWSVTRGILSGKERLVEVSEGVMEVLQTDTAINSGNSGGPLCNSNGEVVGVTNMKLASSQIEGMGFAIPIEVAIDYANTLISGEKVVRPYLGVSIYDANSFFISNGGVYIQYVEPKSPADVGGLKAGDRILKVNDVEISNTSYFRYELYKYKIGDKITITISRDGKEKQIKITLKANNEL